MPQGFKAYVLLTSMLAPLESAPTTLPAQPPGPVIDWSSRYVALVGALQQFRDHPSNPQWWQDFVNNLGKTEGDSEPEHLDSRGRSGARYVGTLEPLVRDLGKLRAMRTTASRHSHESLRAQADPES